jgi:serine protease Do
MTDKHACSYIFKCIIMAMAVAIICEVTIGSAFASGDLQDMVQDAGRSVVMVTSYRSDGSAVAQGSGFFISKDGDVVTCYHLIKGSNSAYLMTSDGAVYPAKEIVEMDEAADLARLSVNLSENSSNLSGGYVSYLTLNTTLPESGQKVFVLGPETNLGRQVVEANVSAVVLNDNLEDAILLDRAISDELIGAPVLNARGEALGVVNIKTEEDRSLSFAIPISRIFGGLWQSLISSREKWRHPGRLAA